MKTTHEAIKEKMLAKGVAMPVPESVFVADDVDTDRISGDGVTVFPGSRIAGKKTLILPGTRIGYEAPVTLEDCLLGKNVRLNGGYFQNAVFLGDNVVGSNAHVRAGTILEEQACAAHTVGLKQTLLFPFVTLGSLINFCDCFMAGGTSRKNHSEVGSSFVHFNYTPNQDKATPSMMGNVHQGVMLDQPPIFLGGQGGLVGPVRIGFGCVTGAGSIVRKDEERPDRMILAGTARSVSLPRRTGVHPGAVRIFNHNIRYMAGLACLYAWYIHVRPVFAPDPLSGELIRGLQETLVQSIRERIRQLEKFCDTLGSSQAHAAILSAMEVVDKQVMQALAAPNLPASVERLISWLDEQAKVCSSDYITAVQQMPSALKTLGSDWLLEIETSLVNRLTV